MAQQGIKSTARKLVLNKDGRSFESSRGQPCRKRFGLLQDSLNGGVLRAGRIAVLAEDALVQNPHPGTSRRTVFPVHGGVAFLAVQQLVGDKAKTVIPHHLNHALVLGEGIVEGSAAAPSAESRSRSP